MRRFGSISLVALSITFSVLFLSSINPAYSASNFANNYFKQTWQYSDKAVDEVPDTGRGYTWGPASISIVTEAYQEAPGGKRQVQYFDKARMELGADGATVTNGLLTKELVSGLRQEGDSKFVQYSPSSYQIAGDDNRSGKNSDAPHYASFIDVVSMKPGQNTASNRVNQLANLSINKLGEVTTLNNPPARALISYYEPTLGHNVPAVFADYQKLYGQVWNGSAYQNGPVYTTNPVSNVFGYPISEPYWIKTEVSGISKNVLVQLYERRVLTYTPSNADPYKVEMGNIGLHYYQWRYQSKHPIMIPLPVVPTPVNQ